ncbi:MAG: helix-turn-helix domain-containing protein [Janthinobacterium lividum]
MRSVGPAGSRALDVAVLGHRLRELRTDRGLSLPALAAAAGTGKGSLSEIEAGQRNPTLATLYSLAAPLAVPLATLLADEPGTEVSSDGLTATLLSTETTADGGTVEIHRVAFRPGRPRLPRPWTRSAQTCAGQGGPARGAPPRRHGGASSGDSMSFSGAGAHRYRPLGRGRVLGGARHHLIALTGTPGAQSARDGRSPNSPGAGRTAGTSPLRVGLTGRPHRFTWETSRLR